MDTTTDPTLNPEPNTLPNGQPPAQPKRARLTLRKKAVDVPNGQRPLVEVQDATGLPVQRLAQTIGELPTADQAPALQEVTQHLAGQLKLVPIKTIHAATPVFAAFKDMHRQRAKNHIKAKLLLSNGSELPLDLVPSYNP